MQRVQGKKAWDFPRNLTSVRLMTQLGMDNGLTIGACLDGTGIHEQELANPTALIAAAQELRLVRNLITHLGHIPGLGIEAGKRYHFTAFGALGLALVCSPSMRSALDICMRYFQLTFAFTRFRVEEHGLETHITLDDSDLDDEVRMFIVERDSSALVTVQRDLFASRPALQEIQFAYAAPANVDVYQTFYGISPVFGAASNQARLLTAALLEPLPQANELALIAAEAQCRALLDRYQSRQGVAAEVRDLVVRHIAHPPDMDMIAEALCVTPRTLRRRLLDEGTTFLKLREEVRQALAEEFLMRYSLSVEQIAERLGYAEPTCFIHAFKRWTGSTPHGFRKERRGAWF